MEFKEIKTNNRLQLEVESENPALRGIVLAVGDHSLILVTDYGESEEVLEDRILSISSISMPKPVSEHSFAVKVRNRRIEIFGTTKTIEEWAEFANITDTSIRSRLYQDQKGKELIKKTRLRKTKIEVTINGTTKSLVEWSKETGITYTLLLARYRLGWDTERLFIPVKKN